MIAQIRTLLLYYKGRPGHLYLSNKVLKRSKNLTDKLGKRKKNIYTPSSEDFTTDALSGHLQQIRRDSSTF